MKQLILKKKNKMFNIAKILIGILLYFFIMLTGFVFFLLNPALGLLTFAVGMCFQLIFLHL